MITVTSLIYYPFKACRRHAVDMSNVERMGLEHDRRMMVVNPEGYFITQRETPKLALVTPSENRLKTLASYRAQPDRAMYRQSVIPLNEGRLRIGMNVEILVKK